VVLAQAGVTPDFQFSRVLGRVKGVVLAVLAALRVAPVPLRALDPPSALRCPHLRSAPRNGPFCLTKEWSLIKKRFRASHNLDWEEE
jgi:hypothetical protein